MPVMTTDRLLTPRELLEQCLAFKQEHLPRGRFLAAFLAGKLAPYLEP